MANIKEYYAPSEVANVLFNLAEPDYTDPDITAEDIETAVKDLENVLYVLKAHAQNSMNYEYYRTLWNCLQEICDRNTSYIIRVTAID